VIGQRETGTSPLTHSAILIEHPAHQRERRMEIRYVKALKWRLPISNQFSQRDLALID
jgi:hypothetical protein